MVNIAKILKNAPEGLKLYSMIHGEVEFDRACNPGEYPIGVQSGEDVEYFDEYGKYFDLYGECVLFPSSEHRTWKDWQKVLIPKCVGSVIVVHNRFCDYEWIVTNNGMFAMNMIENDENYLHPFNEMCYDDFRFATPKEAEVFFERLDRIGYKFENGEVVKKEEKKWSIIDAKDGDFIFDTDNGGIFIFKGFDEDRILRYASLIFGYLNTDPDSYYDSIDQPSLRPATLKEINSMLESLNEEGYTWNPITHRLLKKEETSEKKFTIEDFKPFDKVLVRDSSTRWNISMFSFITGNTTYPYQCLQYTYNQCVPYNEETAHLLGTTENYNGPYKTWED